MLDLLGGLLFDFLLALYEGCLECLLVLLVYYLAPRISMVDGGPDLFTLLLIILSPSFFTHQSSRLQLQARKERDDLIYSCWWRQCLSRKTRLAPWEKPRVENKDFRKVK